MTIWAILRITSRCKLTSSGNHILYHVRHVSDLKGEIRLLTMQTKLVSPKLPEDIEVWVQSLEMGEQLT